MEKLKQYINILLEKFMAWWTGLFCCGFSMAQATQLIQLITASLGLLLMVLQLVHWFKNRKNKNENDE